MEDDAILLKIKRDFTTDEAVQALLQIVSKLEFELGVVKSERDESLALVEKLRTQETHTKKQWLKDELIADMETQLKNHQNKNSETNKSMVEWRNKYFSLLASNNKSSL